MQRSETRILTTHAGSLPRPPRLQALLAARFRGEAVDEHELTLSADAAAREVIARQLDVGLDVVNDGEVGRESFFTYLQHRLSGFGGRSQRKAMGDLLRYPDYADLLRRTRGDADARVDLLSAPRAESAIRYGGTQAIGLECARLRETLHAQGERHTEAFVSSPSPGIVAAAMENAFYDDLPSYVGAVAGALRMEYRAVIDSGLLLQIDAPDLALERHTLFQDRPLSDFLAFMRTVVDALNGALSDLPTERIRLHVCWGNYGGPHDQDVALADIWAELSRARVGALLLSMANPRHAHEYRLLQEVSLPDHLVVIPGVIDTTTNYVEHPETVADRIERVATAIGDPRRVLAGTDCGLETSAGSVNVVPDVAWAKLSALVEGARLASARLFP